MAILTKNNILVALNLQTWDDIETYCDANDTTPEAFFEANGYTMEITEENILILIDTDGNEWNTGIEVTEDEEDNGEEENDTETETPSTAVTDGE